MVNLLPLDEGERITSILPVPEYSEDHYIFMATAAGVVKKTALTEFSRPRSVGLRAIELQEGDTLVGTAITDGESDLMLASSSGKVIRFKEGDVRAMGRTARGVRGIKLADGHRLISLTIPSDDSSLLMVCENGFGKRSRCGDFPVYGRGGQGVIGIQVSERNGAMVGAVQVFEGDEIMLISDLGTLVRTGADQTPLLGRNTQGVTLIRIREDERLVGVARVAEADIESDEGADEGVESTESSEGDGPDGETGE